VTLCISCFSDKWAAWIPCGRSIAPYEHDCSSRTKSHFSLQLTHQ